MSRIGKSPILLQLGVTCTVSGNTAVVQGPKGSLSFSLPSGISVVVKDQNIVVSHEVTSEKGNSIHGLVRAQLDNMVVGVTKGFTKVLTLSGVGYRAAINGTDLVLTVGFSHPVTIKPPAGITFSVTDGKIVVSGIDKQRVGQIAADIRSVKKPEPYKGKGIMYEGERIRKKAGKSAKGVGGAPGATK